MKNLSKRDQAHIWHPLTQHKTHSEMLGIVRASGCTLYDEAGNTYIDGISSWYTAVYGHCNPYITERVTIQMKELDQVVFSGFTHAPAVELSEKLISVLPYNQSKLFFSDNGSTAVEVAIKMGLQFFFNRGEARNKLLAFEDGFHGDTFGAMSVSGLSVYNGPFTGLGLEVLRIPPPSEKTIDGTITYLTELIRNQKVAALVYEPLVQGAAAMRMHSSTALDKLLRFLKEQGVLLIADEVMTGFGKTGTHFASDQIETKPDLICMSKALTAGLLPMAVTSCTQEIFDAFYSEDVGKGFFHGHTYTANPLACTAAIAGLDLLTSDEIQENIARIVESHREFGISIQDHQKVREIRQLGVIFALDLNLETERYGNLRDRMYHHFMSSGVYLRPLGNTIYILPPYIITQAELHTIYQSIHEVLELL